MGVRQPHPHGFSLRFQGKSPGAETKSTTFPTASVIRERKQTQEKITDSNFFDILEYLTKTHKNPKFGKVRQVPTREFPTKFPDWDLSHSSKFGIFVGIL